MQDPPTNPELLVAALGSLPVGLLVANPLGIICWANSRLAAQTGYAVEEMVGQPLTLLLPQVVATGELQTGQSLLRRKNGETDREEHTITPFWDATGQITHVVVALKDIAEEARAAERLSESERRFRDILSTVRMVAMTLDEHGDVTFSGWRLHTVGKQQGRCVRR